MAAVAAVHVPQEEVVGVLGLLQVVHVARQAVRVGRHEVADVRPAVALPARGPGVRADQREARAVVHLDHALGQPGLLLVAGLAVRPQVAGVHVLVAALAAARGEVPHRPAVVVAAQAARPGVGTLQAHPRLELVVELEVVDQDVPGLALVAELALGREAVVGQHGTEAVPPAVARGAAGLRQDAGQHEGGERHRQRDPASETSVDHRDLPQKLLWMKTARVSDPSESNSVLAACAERFQPVSVLTL